MHWRKHSVAALIGDPIPPITMGLEQRRRRFIEQCTCEKAMPANSLSPVLLLSMSNNAWSLACISCITHR